MSKPSANGWIRLRGVRQNNLKGFDLDLPHGQLIVVTGPSGSGKSSLAFETLYAEGQRRYIETFSPYARQFLDRMDKPRVQSIEGIPPAIAIEQRNTVRTTRSTVGTLTEICDYAKIVWRHLSLLHCRTCGQPVQRDTPRRIWESLTEASGTAGAAEDPVRMEWWVVFELPLSSRVSLRESLDLLARQGYQKLIYRDRVLRLEELKAELGADSLTSLRILQARVRGPASRRGRLVEACEQAYHFGKGRLWVVRQPEGTDPHRVSAAAEWLPFSNEFHCARCDLAYREPTPAVFSFNHPQGACPQCKGFGRIITIDLELALPDWSRTLAQGVVRPWLTGMGAECQADLLKFCRRRAVPVDVPFAELPPEQQRWVIEGDPDYGTDSAHEWPKAWYGVKGYFRWLESKSYKMHVRVLLSRYRSYQRCPACQGSRFQPETLLYRLPDPHTLGGDLAPQPGLNLAEFYALPVSSALRLTTAWAQRHQTRRTDPLGLAIQEIQSRLACLEEVGLGYLTLDRPTRTLSGGETERVSLTACLGTRLVNTLFVLDEPSVGLHPRDTARLITVLRRLRSAGNTVVVVEHEAAVMEAADQIVDLGPGHGETGGHLVFQGTYRALCASDSLTADYLSGRRRCGGGRTRPTTPAVGRPQLTLTHVTRHNLKDLRVEIPLGRLVCLCGVSGSGKSTLLNDVLWPLLRNRLGAPVEASPAGDRRSTTSAEASGGERPPDEDVPPAAAREARIEGGEFLKGVVRIDQSSLGRTPRSNPAVYLGAFDHLRDLFAASDIARRRGLASSAFSFNSAQGQCETCRGAGFEKIEMQFLSDVFVKCPTCQGRRYRPHILEVRLRSTQQDEIGGRDGPPDRPAKAVGRFRRNTPGGATLEWSIADLLEATVDEAVGFLQGFAENRSANRAKPLLGLLQEIGLGYLQLGQPINTLSGGERQRLKLVSHLAEHVPSAGPDAGPTLFLLDEPTTGLHFDDIRILLAALHRLVDQGHSVLVIEHNLDVIRAADWVIELGPGAGTDGGRVTATGTPAAIATQPGCVTGGFLRAKHSKNDSGSRRQGGGGGEPR
jgi:excinuclease ABC subunit A